MGLAYKKNIDDWRESPSIEVAALLQKRGATIQFADPHINEVEVSEITHGCAPLNQAALESADLVILLTDHDAFDLPLIVKHASVLFDTRGATRHLADKANNIHLL